MGYVMRPNSERMGLLASANDSDFKNAKGGIITPAEGGVVSQNTGIITVPSIAPGRTMSRHASAPGDITRTAPMFNDPRYTSSTLSIPTDQRTLNGLYRFFGETDPIVGSALRISTELPLADMRLGQCEDSGVQQHYEEMWDRINGRKMMVDITAELHEIGDVTPFAAFNEADYMWDQVAILNPDYVKIESTWLNQRPLIKLIPDEALKKIVHTQSPRFLYDQLPPDIIRYVMFNQEIPLDPNNVFLLSYAKRPYETRGKSLIKRILKTLMLEDIYNQANFALAKKHAVPLTIVKLGDAASGWVPDSTEVDSVREMMAAWELDPNFTIVYHYGIDVQFYGSSGKTLPVGPELDRLYKLKFIGMNVHEQLLSGVGGSYSSAYVNLEVQRQRYLNLQLKLETFVHEGLFKTVADLCGFYRIKQASVGYAGARSSSFGSSDSALKHVLGQFTSIRDFKDNEEFSEFAHRKAVEIQNNNSRQMREYVYPKLDWGNMSAASDENLKNWVKWLRKEVPYLVDDATLARLARLDRDTQEKSYIEDLKRSAKRQSTIAKLGLLPYTNQKPGAGPMDLGGIGNIDTAPGGGGGGDLGDLGGGGDMGGGGGEGLPNAPIGAGGAPAASTGQVPPPAAGGMPRASLDVLERQLAKEVYGEVVSDDLHWTGENADMMKKKAQENYALIKVVRS